MDIIYRGVIIIIIVFVIFIIITAWLCYIDPFNLLSWWNQSIKSECDIQDSNILNGIPSYQNAWESTNKTAQQFNTLLNLNHDDILTEVEEFLSGGDAKLFNFSYPISDHNWIKQEDKWSPLWIRFMGNWNPISEKIPTLRKTVSLFPEIINIYISVFQPGDAVIDHKGLSRATQRYHYGLKIPINEPSLKIVDYDISWEEKQGFVWDDTLSHSAWNHTNQPRIVIFADILRSFSTFKDIGTKFIYSFLQKYKTDKISIPV